MPGFFSGAAEASTLTVIYDFPQYSYSYGRLAQDSKGALYGTDYDDVGGYGAVFRLVQRRGVWGYTTLHEFSGSDGANPYAGLIQERTTGDLYGVTRFGGASNQGTVYALGWKSWAESLLHNFSGGGDGAEPLGLLVQDKANGNLYGTASDNGSYGCGTAFEIARTNSSWTYNKLYSFKGGADGCVPFTQPRAGSKAGVYVGGTIGGKGTLFQLKQSNGVWSESVIHTFTGGSDGQNPYDLDGGSGVIYGVAHEGGGAGKGVVFQLVPQRNKWSYSVIYTFQGKPDGSKPVGINYDAATGALYGTTEAGGTQNQGTVFRLTPNGVSWTEDVLYSFTGASDGATPKFRPIVDRTTGILYGTTTFGGENNGGTVYAVQP